ncbi:MAG: restriction endonuclease subunit S [Opitutales bacterium]|nr:restriction endonuclease subunit S [Opitutales bacterium]
MSVVSTKGLAPTPAANAKTNGDHHPDPFHAMGDKWEIKALKRLASIRFSSVDKRRIDGEQPVQLCNYVDVYRNHQITESLDFMEASASLPEIARFELREGDVLITKDSESWDDIAIPARVPRSLPGVLCGYHLAQIRCNPKALNDRFLNYCLNSPPVQHHFHVCAKGITRYGLSTGDIGKAPIPVTSFANQTAIADYLDRETARIDDLVAREERLLALIEEKRAALISHAVTKGLNPDAEMKDSGIEWIGRIPKTWEVRRLRHVAKFRNSNVDKKTNPGHIPVRLCNYTDVYYNDFIRDEMEFMESTASSSECASFSLNKGDLIITKDSEDPRDIAIPSLVIEELKNVVCGYHLAIISPNDYQLAKYMHRVFQAKMTQAYFCIRSLGVTRYSLNKDAIGNVPVPLPAPSEIRQIVDFVDQQMEHFSRLKTKIHRAIDLLREKRTALISAAVTGRIDVPVTNA